ncbi:holocytochrome c-type synthase-like [Amphiura filiformis]|uniref:holocytochrome c-type synthase-like n=1 Tax=Amphiura filiformis TaxID=82378 RepID=UPI003B2136C5
MGASTSTQAAAAAALPVTGSPDNSPSTPPPECPMHAGGAASQPKQNIPSECPMHAAEQQKTAVPTSGGDAASYPSECPMSGATAGSPALVPQKADDIDPTNMVRKLERKLLPKTVAPPNQRPSPDQPFSLPTSRVTSSIPKKKKENEKWVYPSQQMFWNAMLRKGWRWKSGDIEQADMGNIIRIHNANNEQAWQEVLKWEAMHAKQCSEPKLASFGGRYGDLSPRARIRTWMGYDEPFDRHDWQVDRCGKKIRYIIDYYDSGAVEKDTYKFAILDVRPAFDSLGATWDRMKVAYWRFMYAKKED